MEEILDVVNDADIVTGTATRSEVHAQQWMHRSVHILVFNEQKELYLQRRSLVKDCSPGLWDTSAAGHIGSGESYTIGAKRELNEELGLALSTKLEPLFKLKATAANGFEFVNVFCCIAKTEIVPDPVEIIEGRWIDRDALRRWMLNEPSTFTTTFHDISSNAKFPSG